MTIWLILVVFFVFKEPGFGLIALDIECRIEIKPKFGMIDTLAGYLDSGKIQLFCIDTVDIETPTTRQPMRRWN